MIVEQLNYRSLKQSRSRTDKNDKKNKRITKTDGSSMETPFGSRVNSHGFSLSAETDNGNTSPLKSLFESVKEQGERLASSPTMDNIRRYRQSVARFIAHVNENASVVEESYGILNPGDGSRKKYIAIRIINDKLNTLARTLMAEQKESLDILQKVNEINGLLVDFLG